MSEIKITPVGANQVEEIVTYVRNFRKDLFPMLDHTKIPRDVLEFKETYVDHPQGCFLQAHNTEGKLIGVIGMMPYDHRFEYLNYQNQVTVEVARLFVEPAYRRIGLATHLFQALIPIAQNKGIEQLYLHTHPFLTGAFDYWQKQGFKLVTTTIDGDFTTLHMDRSLSL
ncbi:GNAT family N-acetyltransferase [Myroides sp. WP-1]|uniref:GNAT family N-acetyltransferase n=1 Tax=Myroides sp. WP-1 TaxID=2759944 RepID=UPI0015FBA2F3|nr:GNAT family N-acetyltransferase [Myroides sp. WP-1]MBB1138128.1 GNAT family N-acetyltransferase [Myroides sp. WP-1]